MEGIWNFAYGGNMNPRVLSERRRIDPLESVAGVLEDFRLVFNTRGIPWIEPAFANVEPVKGERVHGVLHRLTPEQFTRLDLFEGRGLAYRHMELDVKAYDGRTIRARVYSAIRVTAEKPPSCRYLNLLREGASFYQLAPEYVRMLSDQPCRNTFTLPDKTFVIFERFFGEGKPVLTVIQAVERLEKLLTRLARRS